MTIVEQTIQEVETDSVPWALELTHTKAVRGMRKTAQRRPYWTREDGRQVVSQRWWMLMQPTMDVLGFQSGPAYWQRELAMRRALQRFKAEGGAA